MPSSLQEDSEGRNRWGFNVPIPKSAQPAWPATQPSVLAQTLLGPTTRGHAFLDCTHATLTVSSYAGQTGIHAHNFLRKIPVSGPPLQCSAAMQIALLIWVEQCMRCKRLWTILKQIFSWAGCPGLCWETCSVLMSLVMRGTIQEQAQACVAGWLRLLLQYCPCKACLALSR